MPIKVSLTALRGPSTSHERDQLLRELAPHASDAALAVFERLWRDPASLLDDGDLLTDDALYDRMGDPVDLTTQLEAIALDPALAGYAPAPITRARFEALSTPPDAVLRALAHIVVDEKSGDEPTLRPTEALVDGQTAPDATPRTDVEVHAIDEDEPLVTTPQGGAALDERAAEDEHSSALPEPAPPDDVSARDDIPAAAGIPQTEETMAVKHEQREGGEDIPAEEIDAPAPADAADPTDAQAPESSAVDTSALDTPGPDAGADAVQAEAPSDAPSADAAVDEPTADLAPDDEALDDDAPEDVAPDDDALADDALDAAALDGPGEVVGYEGDADDLFEAVPPTARHFLALVDARGEVEMPEVMQHLGLVRAKGVGGAIEPIQRIARLLGVKLPFTADFASSGNKRWRWTSAPLVDVPAETLEALPMPPPTPKKKKKKARGRLKREYKKQWGKRAGKKGGERRGGKKPRPRQPAAGPESTGQSGARAERPARARGASAPPADRAPRRRRFDRPMPEVFRRGGRADDRAAPPRRERGASAESGGRSRSSERISRSIPAVERRGPDRPSRGPGRFEADERVETPSSSARAEAPARGRSRSDAPAGARVDRPSTAGRVDAPGQGRIDGPSAMRRVDVPGRIAASRAEVERRSDPPEASSPPSDEATPRKQAHSPEERLPLPRSGVFRRRTVSDTDVPVVVIRRRKR